MKPSNLTIFSPNRPDHFAALTDMCTKIFTMSDYFQFYAYITNYLGNSHYDWRISRIGMINDLLITNWGVFDYLTRVGSARLRTAGVGVVFTHPDYRKKGYLLRTANESLAAAREDGYAISVLFGIPGFYDKLGYCTVWPQQSYHLALAAMPRDKPALKPRAYRTADFKHVCAFYNRSAAALSGTAVRPTYTWIKDPHHAFCWWKPNGSLAGYALFDTPGKTLVCRDAAGDPDQILQVAGWYARKHSVRKISFRSVHHESRLGRCLRGRDCRVETFYQSNGGPMARIISLERTLQTLCAELARRLKQSDLADWQGTLRISNRDENVCLAITNGSVSCVPETSAPHTISGGPELVRLFLGSDDPIDLAREASFRLSGDGKRLLRVLFPVQYPMLSACDSF